MLICGVDEVGRGPWAGPVIAAAVILPKTPPPFPFRDSKALSAKKREILANWILEHTTYGIGGASAREIDAMNILQATFLAMHRALHALPITPTQIDIDGNRLPPHLPAPATAIVKGDTTHQHIAAASILAKVTRDKLMTKLATKYPHYAWERNAGYGTKAHIEGIAFAGLTSQHRRSFKPIALKMAEIEQQNESFESQ